MVVSPVHGASLLAGAISFPAYFVRGEHHLHIVLYIKIFLATITFAVLGEVYLDQVRLLPAVLHVSSLAVLYLLGLYSTRASYRLLFHPLRRFPGSLGSRATGFWLSWQSRRGDVFRQIKNMHDRYGAFVRIGPNNLSIAHPKAVQLVYGAGSRCTKAAWYDLTKPVVSLQTFREKKLHEERRRIWSGAFGDKALRGYEQRLRAYRSKLISHFAESDGQAVNVTKWFNLYSFDVMGDLAFGKPFDMLQTSREHWAVKLLNAALEPLAYAFPVWFFRVATAIPGATKDWWRFMDFCAERMNMRLKTSPDVPDIMSALSAPYKGEMPNNNDWRVLRGDAQLIVVAGSDTTATTLSAAIYQLLQNPKYIEILREELAPYMDESSGEVSNEKIVNLKHLNAVIYETLRMHPPVPSLLQRKTPPEGMSVDGIFIPGNTVVSCPQFVIGRSAAAYEDPESFVPERWYSKPEMVREKGAWAPFGAGPYGCIGRPLAMLNVRTTLARIVMFFDISFAPGESGEKFEGAAREKFTMGFGDLMVSFRPRL